MASQAQLASARGDGPEAAHWLGEVIKRDPDNIVALNNLAWYYRDREPSTALEYARRAYTLAPKSVQILDTYAEVLARTGDIKQASAVMDQAVGLSGNDPEVLRRRAEISKLGADRAPTRN